MEQNHAADNVREVAAPEMTAVVENTAVENSSPSTADNGAEPATKAFSERLNKEREKFKAQADEKIKTYEDLFEAIKGLGIDASTPQALTEKIKAEMQTITHSKQDEESKIGQKKELSSHPEILAARHATQKAEEIIRQSILDADLQAVKQAYPDVKAKDVSELGDTYMVLMQTGKVDALTAYAAQLQVEALHKKQIPPSMGGIKSTAADTEKEYYSPEDVDRLPKNAYNNPKIMEKIRKSMPKWK